MNATEFCLLTEASVAELLAQRSIMNPQTHSGTKGRRVVPRWPFPGTVELWVPDENGLEWHRLAMSLDLSLSGVGVRADEPLSPGMKLAIAIHEPEVSFHGRAEVRHCSKIGQDYLIGLQFLFDAE